MKEQQLPGLFYVDDIVLLADKQADIQRLADICGQEAKTLGFRFSVKKSGLMVNDSSYQAVLIQGQEIPRVREYKYLSVWINEGNRYLAVEEKTTIAKGKRKQLRNMKESRWAARVFRYLYRKSVNSQWRKKTRRLTSKYEAGSVSDMATKNVKRKVREAEKNYWIVAMDKNPAMSNYHRGKDEIRWEAFYGNSTRSALLFEVRSGCLRTRCYKAKYRNEEDACACCGKAKKTMEHVLLECE